MDGRRDTGLVSDAGAAANCSTQLGVRAGLDDALCADGDCRVVGDRRRRIALADMGDCAFSFATGVEFCVVMDLFQESCDWRCADRGRDSLGGDHSHDDRIRAHFAVGGMADGTLPGLGELCEFAQ